ncbi:MAG: Gfo/Idh/MocA family oxidoreductase [Ilumatobacteraceae bacterium]|nr:Gfo/Idh/MocA family oxidoreductase [Ilumatobacteraceae bacterium]
MSDAPLQTVIFSGVRHARNYADVIAAHPDVELVAVHDSDDAPDWAHADTRAVAERSGVPVVDSIPDDADLVIVCSEPTRHAACALAAMEAGHHVLIDKPAATTLADVLALRAMSRERQLVCTSVNRTLLASTRRAKATIDAGHIGFARSVDVEFLSDGAQFATAVERPELVIDATLSGGGEIMNFMGYCIDSVRVLTGCEPLEVFGYSATAFSELHREAGAEDVAVVSARFTHGVVATITVGRIPAAPSAGPGASTVRIVGSHGHLLADDSKPAVALHRANREVDAIHAGSRGEHEAVSEMLHDVVGAIRHGQPLRYTIDDAAIAIAAIEATYRSIETGRPVAVAQLD